MKTTYGMKDVAGFLRKEQPRANTPTVVAMAEGHTSQVFRFQADDGNFYVFRIRASEKDLLADQYAYRNFSGVLPLPSFVRVGQFDSVSYYCITEYISGRMLDTLNEAEFRQYLPAVRQSLARTFQVDIAQTSGYGDVAFDTGNAQSPTWKAALKAELLALNVDNLRQNAKNIHLPDSTVDLFVKQFEDNLPYASEVRRLLHGDPAGNNMLVNNGKVVAVLDWEQMAYGDWMRDFSRFSFWGKKNYGDALEFANEFNLELENVREREALYWSIHALRAIEFADTRKNEKVAVWVRMHIKDKLNTQAAKEIAHERDAFMRQFLQEFLDEWDGRK